MNDPWPCDHCNEPAEPGSDLCAEHIARERDYDDDRRAEREERMT